MTHGKGHVHVHVHMHVYTCVHCLILVSFLGWTHKNGSVFWNLHVSRLLGYTGDLATPTILDTATPTQFASRVSLQLLPSSAYGRLQLAHTTVWR